MYIDSVLSNQRYIAPGSAWEASWGRIWEVRQSAGIVYPTMGFSVFWEKKYKVSDGSFSNKM